MKSGLWPASSETPSMNRRLICIVAVPIDEGKVLLWTEVEHVSGRPRDVYEQCPSCVPGPGSVFGIQTSVP